jgi:hypothetical protein
MGAIDPGTKFHVLFAIKNGWTANISRYRTQCHFNKVMDDKNSAFIVGAGEVNAINKAQWVNANIAGGSGATDRCFTDYMAFNGPIVCVDVTVDVQYELQSRPGDFIFKPQRFVTARGNGPHWYEMSPDTPGNYCDGVRR